MGDKLNTTELKNVFLDVRKSYRLLYNYQRHVLDLVKYIGNRLEFGFETGWQLHPEGTSTPKRFSLNSWEWEWIKIHRYQFYFGEQEVKNQNITFAINLVSDTGYFNPENNSSDKNNHMGFVPVEASGTKLVLIIGQNMWDWSAILGEKGYSDDEVEHVKSINHEIMLAKTYDLEQFIDQASTERIVDEFGDFCSRKKVQIKP